MSIKQVNPYILLSGTGAKAIALYESALGATTGAVTHYGDMPGTCVGEDRKHLIMHAELRLGEHVLMLSDCPPMAIHDAFWGAKFGMLTDAFGVRWMFNCQGHKAEA